MHAVFIPYGKRDLVELFLREMEAQKYLLELEKGNKKKYVWLQGQVRLLPFGIVEHIFPKKNMDIVLTTLRFHEKRYKLNWFLENFLKKIAQCEPIPKFKISDKKLLWIMDNVNIIPLGVRYDDYIVEPENSKFAGWKHEAI